MRWKYNEMGYDESTDDDGVNISLYYDGDVNFSREKYDGHHSVDVSFKTIETIYKKVMKEKGYEIKKEKIKEKK